MYSWRARLGVLVPSAILAIEPEFNRMVPEGVTCHYHRIPFLGGGLKDLKAVEQSVADATRILLHARPSVMVMSGTGVSFAGGYGYDQSLIAKMREINGNLPTTTTSTSVIEALKKLGIKKVSVATPYLEEVAKAAARFVDDSGIKVLDLNWLGKATAIEDVSQETIYHLARQVDKPESEAIFISCINLHTIELIEKLENDLGKPVISSNQATMWNLLRMAGVQDKLPRYGQLFMK